MREPEAPDLGPLDPGSEADRWDRMVSIIMARCAPELRRRQNVPNLGVFDGLLAWSRPALATAAALALLSLLALTQLENRTARAQSVAYMKSPNMPEPMTIMLEEGEAPSMLDMLVLSEREN
jgi:hypothetical protein